MAICLICRKFSNDKLISINETIDQIQIKNILNDLNFKFPWEEYEFTSKAICMECCYNLKELFTFRDYCCELLFEYVIEKSNNIKCWMCCKEIILSQEIPSTSYTNGVLMKNSDIFRQICSYDFNDKSCDNLCMNCYQYLIRVYGFYLKCNASMKFWTNHVFHVILIKNKFNRFVKGIVKYRYECKVCLKSFVQFGRFKKHTKVHNRDKKSYLCEICSKLFNNNSHLKRHLKIHTSEKPYKCEICFKSFPQSSYLKSHLKVHDSVKKSHLCEICSKLYSCNSSFQRHLKIHSGKKPCTCNVCSKSFKDLGDLNKHLKLHTGEKLYKCEICPKSFTQSLYLKRHLIVHNNSEKSFICNVCSRSFSRPDNLRTHLRIHTGEKPFECKICSKSFRHNVSLRTHLKVHNG